jgi:hypothetical protein
MPIVAARLKVQVQVGVNSFLSRIGQGMYFGMRCPRFSVITFAHDVAILYYYSPHHRIGTCPASRPGGKLKGYVHVIFGRSALVWFHSGKVFGEI